VDVSYQSVPQVEGQLYPTRPLTTGKKIDGKKMNYTPSCSSAPIFFAPLAGKGTFFGNGARLYWAVEDLQKRDLGLVP
jgi:hypothetical protein